MPDGATDHLAANVDFWTARDEEQLATARRGWQAHEPTWGIFGVAEADAGILRGDLSGARVVELGCGTGYVSAWLARRGASPIGLDPTPNQLRITRQMQREHQMSFPLVLAAGEQVPLRDGCCDLIISEYGAAIWADPLHWIAEAARLLRPGGELVFLGNSSLLMLCQPDEDDLAASERLVRPQRGMHRFEWPDDPTVEFHLSHGDWIRLLRANRFEVEELIELYAPEGATSSYSFVTADWARQWPAEEVWRARRQ